MEKRKEIEIQNINKFELDEKEKNKKLKRVYKILNQEWEDLKGKRSEKADMMTARKELEADAAR
jgi:hypothetical protein